MCHHHQISLCIFKEHTTSSLTLIIITKSMSVGQNKKGVFFSLWTAEESTLYERGEVKLPLDTSCTSVHTLNYVMNGCSPHLFAQCAYGFLSSASSWKLSQCRQLIRVSGIYSAAWRWNLARYSLWSNYSCWICSCLPSYPVWVTACNCRSAAGGFWQKFNSWAA